MESRWEPVAAGAPLSAVACVWLQSHQHSHPLLTICLPSTVFPLPTVLVPSWPFEVLPADSSSWPDPGYSGQDAGYQYDLVIYDSLDVFAFSISLSLRIGHFSIVPVLSDRYLWWSCQRVSTLKDHLSAQHCSKENRKLFITEFCTRIPHVFLPFTAMELASNTSSSKSQTLDKQHASNIASQLFMMQK